MSHPIDQYVGQRLRLRRSILGLSQEAIGKSIGISFQQIQKYERGVNRMGASRLYEFSKMLGVPVAYFFEGYESQNETVMPGMAESAQPGFEVEDKVNSRESMEIIRAYYQIQSKVVRKRLFDLIKSLAADK